MVPTAGYSSASPEKMTLPELWELWYVSQHWKTNRLTSTNLQYYYVFLPAAYEMQSELLEANYISYTILLAWKPLFKFLNRLVLLNLYLRDTEKRRTSFQSETYQISSKINSKKSCFLLNEIKNLTGIIRLFTIKFVFLQRDSVSLK